MNCPSEIAEVAVEILYLGTLRVRFFAGACQPQKCFVEADHLHNLPHLLSDYRPERLRYYCQKERSSFMRQVPEDERRDLQPLWDRMALLMEQHEISLLEKAAG
jgi:hypothetical protein